MCLRPLPASSSVWPLPRGMGPGASSDTGDVQGGSAAPILRAGWNTGAAHTWSCWTRNMSGEGVASMSSPIQACLSMFTGLTEWLERNSS